MAWLPRLDTRLNCIAEEVPACNLAADIGADHGKLSCWLLASGRVQRMIVSDISKVSRDKARDLFIRHEVMDRVTLLGADGLHAIAGSRPDVVIIGCEPFLNGVASALRHVEEGGLKNVRLHADDARAVM